MYATVQEQPIKLSRPGLLKQFEGTLPDFRDLDAEGYLKFVRAIQLLATKYAISHEDLDGHGIEHYRPQIDRMNELYGEYFNKDRIIASAILTVKMHIESYYSDDRDAKLVHTLTGLHIYYSDGGDEQYIMPPQ